MYYLRMHAFFVRQIVAPWGYFRSGNQHRGEGLSPFSLDATVLIQTGTLHI